MTVRKRRQEGTERAFLTGASRVQPLFQEYDHSQPFNPDDPRHGTYAAYVEGCRCEWCKLAGKAYRQHRALDLPLPRGWNAKTDGLV